VSDVQGRQKRPSYSAEGPKPFVTAPIVGATKPHHLSDAVAALDITLSEDEVAQLEEPYEPHPVAGFR
jgi:1-deoxyxylulose-5-phosphate synthase